ncbi:Protein of unknown function [Gryllus bimaculatus]|nr:Protein of unknown function [Gryllus bimaculatus]
MILYDKHQRLISSENSVDEIKTFISRNSRYYIEVHCFGCQRLSMKGGKSIFFNFKSVYKE